MNARLFCFKLCVRRGHVVPSLSKGARGKSSLRHFCLNVTFLFSDGSGISFGSPFNVKVYEEMHLASIN